MQTEVTTKVTSKDLTVSRSDLYNVRPENIRPEEGFNARNFARPEVQAHIQELKHQILESGQLMPVRAYFDQAQGVFVLTDGQCRWTAISQIKQDLVAAGKDEEAEAVTVKVISVKKSEASLENRLFEMMQANTSLRFTPVETGEAYLKLKNLGLNEAKIAQRTGTSVANVYNLMLIGQAPQRLKDMIEDGTIKYTVVLKAFRELQGWDETTNHLLGILENIVAENEVATESVSNDVEDETLTENETKAVTATKAPKGATKKVKITEKDLNLEKLVATPKTVSGLESKLNEVILGIEKLEGELPEALYNVLTLLSDEGTTVNDIVNYVKKLNA